MRNCGKKCNARSTNGKEERQQQHNKREKKLFSFSISHWTDWAARVYFQLNIYLYYTV